MKRLYLVLILSLMTACSYAFDFPNDALQLLAEAAVDPCSICVKQKLDKAFLVMNARFNPGFFLNTDDTCRLVKVDPGDDNELSLTCYPQPSLKKSLKEGENPPQFFFKFYTPGKRLVGISEKDYTEKTVVDLYNASKPGTIFEGSIKFIPYKYGDGPTYNYFLLTNKLVIHCIVLQLKPVQME